MNTMKEIFGKCKKIKFGSATLMLIFCFVFCPPTFAQTTEFTYQGKLNDTGTPSATYDFEFRLCASETSCSTPLAIDSRPGIAVSSGGIFTVKINFGSGQFDGSDRFLEIAVKRPSDTIFVTLAPRQQLTSTPYTIQSLKANNSLQLGGVAANQFVLTGDPRLDANNYVQNTLAPQTSVNFNIGGTGAANILNATSQFNLGGSRILSNTGTNNLFAGVGAGAGNTTGNSNSFFGANTGNANTTGTLNSFFGTSAGLSSTTGGFNSFFGFEAGKSNTISSGNSFFGERAGRLSTAGGNSFFGSIAGTNNTTGNFNSFFGDSAGVNNTTGSSNTFIGEGTGILSTTTPQVNNSTAIGTGARVSTSNTIVLGTNLETTRIPGKMVTNKLIMGGGALESGGVAQTFDSGSISGIFTGNIFLSGLNNLLASPVHLCIRTTSLGGGFGGEGLARCSTQFSSVTNKTDVQSFSSGLSVIKRLKPVSFKWKSDNTNDVGLNAEDVAEIAPQLVTRSDKGEIEDVKEGSLNVLFINAFKEQQSQIEAQAAQIKQQQQQIDALKNLVCAMSREAEICKEKRDED